jgi:hypothetical protein
VLRVVSNGERRPTDICAGARLGCDASGPLVKAGLLHSFERSKSQLMANIVDWDDDHIGQRLRLRDLRVFFAVMQSGSLAKAAARLRVTQPAV